MNLFVSVRGTRTAPRVALVAIALLLALAVATSPSHAEDPPIPGGPIDPNNGEATLLDLVAGLPINDIQNALTNFPVPYIVVATADGAEPVVVANRAGAPTRVDADRSKTTGQGNSGHDLIVEVNTGLFPTPNLTLDITRLGNAPFANDLQVVVVFPFTAFNDEDELPGGNAPNLFFGYESTAPFDAVTETYGPGGHAPQRVSYVITPGALSGTAHVFDMDIATTGASNPLRFIAGHFNAPPGASHPEDAIGMAFLTDPVPALISMSIDTNASAIVAGGTTMAQFGVDWQSSGPTKVIFDYIENESFPFPIPQDYGTSLSFDQMPTSQSIDLGIDFVNQIITLELAGNAPIGTMALDHRRGDGLNVDVLATDVPTEVSMTLDFGGSLEVLVNQNTMDVELTATQSGATGFPGSSGLFGYPLRFFYIGAVDVPDTQASWDTTTQTYSVGAINDGESIGSVAFVLDDDASSIADDLNLDLPPDQTSLGTGVGIPWDQANRHIFSVADNGTNGTAAVRLVDVVEASVSFTAATLDDISNAYRLETAAAHPLTAYLRLHPGSTLTDQDIEATCNVHDYPGGVTEFSFELPPPTVKFSYKNLADPPQGIDELFCVGFVNTLNFEVLASDLPPEWDFDFDPAGSLSVIAEDGLGGPATIGTLGIRLWDPTDPNGLGLSTNVLFGEVLRDARARVDDVPSFNATWENDAAKTEINFDTVGNIFMGGAQVAVSTHVEFDALLPEPSSATPHYLHFRDDGADAKKHLRAGIFGLDAFSYLSSQTGDDRSLGVSYAGNINRKLQATFVSPFEGQYFPAYELNLALEVDAVPATWDMSTDFATQFQYTASDGIDNLTLTGTIGQKEGDTVHTTNIDFLLDDAPSSVSFDLETGDPGSATLLLGSAIKEVRAELWSATKVLGQDYKHILLSTKDIPDGWIAEWALEGDNPSASLSTSAPLGPVSIILSKDPKEQTPGKYDVFKQPLAGVQYTDYAREIDRRYFVVGQGGEAARDAALMGRLDSLYGDTVQFTDGDDHFIMRKSGGSTNFMSVQGTGFQCAAFQVVAPSGDDGFQCLTTPKNVHAGEINVSAAIPVAGLHPFFVGVQDSDTEYTIAHIPNIPDEASVVVGATRAHIDFSSSPGTITLYKGHLPGALDGQTALKLQLVDTPAFVHADWNLGFPGGVTVNTSNPFELRIVSQNASSRIVGAVRLQGLAASWGTITLEPTIDCPFPGIDCATYVIVVGVRAELAATGIPLDGLLMQYDRIGAPKALVNPAGPAAADAEYVPRISFLMDDFQSLEVSAGIEVCTFFIGLVPCAIGVPLPFIDVDVSVGGINFDWWDMGGGPLGVLGDEDYFENNPWHFVPLLHGHGTHVFPFGP